MRPRAARLPALALVSASACACAGRGATARPTYDLGSTAAAATGRDDQLAQRLLAEAIAAKGGRARLEAFRGVHATGTIHIASGTRRLDGTFERWFAVPDRQRLDVTVGDRTVSVIVAGDEVVQRQDGRSEPVAGTQADQLVDALWRDRDALLVHALERWTTVRDPGHELVDGASYDVLTIAGGDARVAARVFLDPATHLIARIAPLGDTASDLPAHAEYEEYGDYREVDGLQLAHRVVLQGPSSRSELRVDALDLGPLADDVFAPAAGAATTPNAAP